MELLERSMYLECQLFFMCAICKYLPPVWGLRLHTTGCLLCCVEPFNLGAIPCLLLWSVSLFHILKIHRRDQRCGGISPTFYKFILYKNILIIHLECCVSYEIKTYVSFFSVWLPIMEETVLKQLILLSMDLFLGICYIDLLNCFYDHTLLFWLL